MDVNDAHFEMKIVGDFNAFNALAAYSVLKELGLNNDAIRKDLTHTLQIMAECNTLNVVKKKQ